MIKQCMYFQKYEAYTPARIHNTLSIVVLVTLPINLFPETFYVIFYCDKMHMWNAVYPFSVICDCGWHYKLQSSSGNFIFHMENNEQVMNCQLIMLIIYFQISPIYIFYELLVFCTTTALWSNLIVFLRASHIIKAFVLAMNIVDETHPANLVKTYLLFNLYFQTDKDFVWSLWKRLQVTSPDITQVVSMVVQRLAQFSLTDGRVICPRRW